MKGFVRVNIFLKHKVEWDDSFIERFKVKSITLVHPESKESKQFNFEKVEFSAYDKMIKHISYNAYLSEEDNKVFQEYVKSTYTDYCNDNVVLINIADDNDLKHILYQKVNYYDLSSQNTDEMSISEKIALTESYITEEDLTEDELEYIENERKKQDTMLLVHKMIKRDRSSLCENKVCDSLFFINMLNNYLRDNCLEPSHSIIAAICYLIKDNKVLIKPFDTLIKDITGMDLNTVIKKILNE